MVDFDGDFLNTCTWIEELLSSPANSVLSNSLFVMQSI